MENTKQLTKKIKATKMPDELLAILGKTSFDTGEISYRGGTLGFDGDFIAEFVGTDDWLLPRSFGAYCNYLGGGLRGTINASDFSSDITGTTRELLEAIANACVRFYNYYEADNGLQDETDEDGETNWENWGTNLSRKAGISSGY
jgi:hypothetical protein